MATPTKRPSEPSRSEIATPAGEVGIIPMDITIRTKLSIMMFLQYFTWGAWYVTMGNYMNHALACSGEQIGWAYAASPIGAMIAPFFVGMIADRFFATQHILAALHLLGAALLFGAASVESYSAFFPMLLLYFLCYMPTLALTNSISFSHMSNPEQQFPGIRVLGTIGWIAAGQLVGRLLIEDQNTPFLIGAVSSGLLGLYCLTLPHTPPANPTGPVRVRDILGLDALALMRRWSFAVFVIGSFLICIPLQFYYGATNLYLNEIKLENPAATMTIGQMSEIFFMLIMPFFFIRLGVKYMLLVGMAAWAVRVCAVCPGRHGAGHLDALPGHRLAWRLLRLLLRHGLYLRRQEGAGRDPSLGPGIHHVCHLGRRRLHRLVGLGLDGRLLQARPRTERAARLVPFLARAGSRRRRGHRGVRAYSVHDRVAGDAKEPQAA